MKHPEIIDFALKRTRGALRRLSERLQQATRHPQDAEAIHDLRVSVRRFSSCVNTFEDFLDPAVVKRAGKALRKLMKHCGETRNYDIARELLRDAGVPKQNGIFAKLKTGRNRAERKMARELSKNRLAHFRKRNRIHLNEQSSASDHWRLQETVASNAQTILPPLCLEFFETGAAAVEAVGDYEMLHKFRLSTKRFRYTVELFEDVYKPGIESRLADLGALQDRLGLINDCHATLEILGNNRVAVQHVQAMLQQRDQAFRIFWQAKFARKARSWSRWLGRPSNKPV